MHSHLPPKLLTQLDAQGLAAPLSSEPLAGGSINQVLRLRFDSGRSLIAKLNPQAPSDFFSAEQRGLELLAQHTKLRIPAVEAAGEGFCLLEDLGSGQAGAGYWEALGRGLAGLHRSKGRSFGADFDNYCGATAQLNTPSIDGFEFFAEQRLLALGSRCKAKGLLPAKTLTELESLARRLPELLPDAPPVCLHGDLWSGNVHCDGDGQPALIDPAAYWGWAETDLAMTTLFGGFEERFYDSYEEAAGISGDWRERAPILNLYPLLNHLLLFGAGYLNSIEQTLANY